MSKFIEDIKTEKENRYVEASIKSVEMIADDGRVVCDALDALIDLQERYSESFIYLYKYPFIEDEHDSVEHFKNKFYPDFNSLSWLIHSELIDYNIFTSMTEAIREDKFKEIKKLEKNLKKKEDRLSKVNNSLSKARGKNKTYYKNLDRKKSLERDITELKIEVRDKRQTAEKGITFGGKKQFRYINKLEYYNQNILPEYKDYSVEDIDNLISEEQKVIAEKKKNKERVDYKKFRTLSQIKALKENPNLLEEKKDEYRNNRIRPIFISGEAIQTGNRCFDFHHLIDGILYFKFDKKTYKITLDTGNRTKLLTLLSALAGTKETAISVKMDFREDKMSIQLGYNVKQISKYLINIDEVYDSINTLTTEDYNKRSVVYDILQKNIYNVKKNIRLKWNRCLGVDLNPDNVGVSVIKRIDEHTYKVLYTEVLYYPELIEKLGVKSTDQLQIDQNNKIKYEIINMCHYIFRLAVHYRCSMFVCEMLKFESDDDDTKSKQVNRKCKNMWHRTLFDEMFRKLAAANNMKFRKIKAAYTSFIGNIQHPFPDAASAAAEIARRGMFSDVKYSFYPKKTESDTLTLRTLFGDELCQNDPSWKEMYSILKETLGPVEMNRIFRYGNVDERSLKKSRLLSHSSKVKSVRCYKHRTPMNW